MTIGEFIYKKRLIKNMTVIEFAMRLGILPSEVNCIENNLFELTLDYVENIADILTLNSSDYDIFMGLYNSDSENNRLFIMDKLLKNIGKKNPINTIRVPLELKLSKAEWQSVLNHFNENIL